MTNGLLVYTHTHIQHYYLDHLKKFFPDQIVDIENVRKTTPIISSLDVI